MRTCYCNGVTSDPPGPAAVAGPGLGAGPGASTGPGAVRPLEIQRKSRLDHQKRDFGISRAPAQRCGRFSSPSPTPRPLEIQRKSRLDHQKRDFGISRAPAQRCGRFSSPSPTAAASRAPAQRRRSHLGSGPTATAASPLKHGGGISGPGATATVASRVRSNGDGCISAQNESAPAEHLGGGAQIALFYKAQLSKTTPRYRGS